MVNNGGKIQESKEHVEQVTHANTSSLSLDTRQEPLTIKHFDITTSTLQDPLVTKYHISPSQKKNLLLP